MSSLEVSVSELPVQAPFLFSGFGAAEGSRRVTTQEIAEKLVGQGVSEDLLVPKDLEKKFGNARFPRLAEGETNESLGADSLEEALEDADIDPGEVDVLFVPTSTSTDRLPTTANVIHDMVGLGEHCEPSDLVNACGGWLNALRNAAGRFAAFSALRYIAVTAVDTPSPHLRSDDPETSFIFSDRAVTTILERDTERRAGYLTSGTNVISKNNRAFLFPDGGSISWDGNTVAEDILEASPKAIEHAETVLLIDDTGELIETRVSLSDLDAIEIHQSSGRMVSVGQRTIRRRNGLPAEDLSVNIHNITGNSSSSTTPDVFRRSVESGRIVEGNNVGFLAPAVGSNALFDVIRVGFREGYDPKDGRIEA